MTFSLLPIRPATLLLFTACTWLMACTAPKPASASGRSATPVATSGSALSGKTDLPVLMPAGHAATWPVAVLRFDGEVRPSYSLHCSGRVQNEREGLGIFASPVQEELPKSKNYGTYEPQLKTVDYSKEVFIPAFGRKVAWYLSEEADGTQNAIYKTVPVAWPDGHGGTVYYVIQAEVAASKPEALLSQVKWGKPGALANVKVKEDS